VPRESILTIIEGSCEFYGLSNICWTCQISNEIQSDLHISARTCTHKLIYTLPNIHIHSHFGIHTTLYSVQHFEGMKSDSRSRLYMEAIYFSSFSVLHQAGRSWFGGSIPGRDWEFFPSPPRPPSLLSNGYGGGVFFPRGWSTRGVTVTTHLLLAPRLWIRVPIRSFSGYVYKLYLSLYFFVFHCYELFPCYKTRNVTSATVLRRPLLDHPPYIWWRIQIMCNFLRPHTTSSS
jgi:hypothetical protein